jgi:hypothetical protein
VRRGILGNRKRERHGDVTVDERHATRSDAERVATSLNVAVSVHAVPVRSLM